jgi:transposase-like protein
MNELNLGDCTCPTCKQEYNGLSIQSCVSTEFSKIHCAECGFSYSGELCEEDLTDQFFKTYKELTNQDKG